MCDVVAPYGFERRIVDGADVAALWSAFGEFVAAARAGRRAVGGGRFCWSASPTAAAATTRATSRPTATRSPSPSAAELDPIARLERLAVDAPLAAQGRRPRRSRPRARAEVEAAVAFGRDSPPLRSREAAELVYAGAAG